MSPFIMRCVLPFLLLLRLSICQDQSPAREDQPYASILYTAVVRGKVALPCDINPPTPDDSVALILWYKDDALTPIYTLDSRKGYLDQARSLTSPLLENRAYFNLHNRPAFLHIDPIRLTDAGDYRCRVDFKKARTVNTVISLKVIVPPDEPVISDVDGNELKGLVGPFNEGESLRLLCSSSGGQPRPTLTWWRDYNIIDDTFEYNEKDVAMNQLTIPSLARHHLLSIFTCQALNNNITVPASSSITLDLNLKPTEVKITQLTPVLVADQGAVLECTAFGSRPKAVIFWSFDGQRMTTPLATGSLGEHQTSTTITITPKQEHNGAEVTCTAENPKISDSGVSEVLRLDVQFAPKLSLQLGSPGISLQKIQEGNDIYFDCHIVSNPGPNKPIVWKRNGVTLLPGPGVIQSNQTLVLQRVSKEQKGAYQCEASNSIGTSTSNNIHLKIRYAPVCVDEAIVYTYGVSLHENVQLPCFVEANPPQVSFSWKFQGSLDLTTFVQTNETSSTLTYAPHSPQEYGSIECRGKNDVGLQQKPCKYQIIPAGPPTFPFTCQVVNQSYDSLSVRCIFDSTEGSNNNSWNANHLFPAGWQDRPRRLVHPRTQYVCEVYHLTSSHLLANVTTVIAEESSSTSSSPLPRRAEGVDGHLQFLISNLPSETTLRLRLFAQNSKGKSDSSWIRAQTLRPPERLIESSQDILSLNDNSDIPNSNGISASSLLHQPHLISLVVGFFVITSSAILFGILLLVKFRKSRSASCSLMGSNSCHLTSSNLRDSPDQMSSDSSENLKRGGPPGGNGGGPGNGGGHPTFYPTDNKCCCDEFCDDPNVVGRSHSHHQSEYEHTYHGRGYSTNCPPDMIPSYNPHTYSTIPLAIHTAATEVSDDMSDHASISGPVVGVFPLTDKSFVAAFGNELGGPGCPPDMIPSFAPSNYSTTSSSQLDQHSSTDGTHLTEFDQIYHQKLLVEPESLQYAEVSFDPSSFGPPSGRIHLIPTSTAGTINMLEQSIVMSGGGTLPRGTHHLVPPSSHQSSGVNVEYARVEFNKNSRVTVVSGSPKFESTV